MVALAKMRESRRRGRPFVKLCADCFSFEETESEYPLELGRYDVSRGESPMGGALFEAGKP